MFFLLCRRPGEHHLLQSLTTGKGHEQGGDSDGHNLEVTSFREHLPMCLPAQHSHPFLIWEEAFQNMPLGGRQGLPRTYFGS